MEIAMNVARASRQTMSYRLILVIAATLTALAGPVFATQPQSSQFASGLLPLPANRIVGLWDMTVTVGPCAGGPTQTFKALNTFHAGGTLSDRNTLPGAARASGQGIWNFVGNHQYRTRFQFYRFQPDGSFDGTQDVRTTIVLNRAANAFDVSVRADALNADGSLRVALCGSGNGTRVSL
jgi:hypothetical protein